MLNLEDYIPQLGKSVFMQSSSIMGGGVSVFGDAWYVDADNGSDDSNGQTPSTAFATISKAYESATTNNNDVIFLSNAGSHTLTEMLTISKSRIAFVGADFATRTYGQGSRINMGVTLAETDVFAVKNTGVRNSFSGIKFSSSNTLTENVGTFGEGGEYTVFNSCEFYNSGKQASDTHAELVLNGDSAQFNNCTIGSLATAVTGDKVRPAVLLTKATVAAGKVSRDVLFNNCRFWKNAGGTTTAMIKGGATDVERVMEFKDCIFMANSLGSAPAVAIDVATLTVGQIITTGSTCSIGCTKTSTAVGVFNCTPTYVATATIGIQST